MFRRIAEVGSSVEENRLGPGGPKGVNWRRPLFGKDAVTRSPRPPFGSNPLSGFVAALALAATLVSGPALAASTAVAVPERALWESNRGTLDEWGFLAGLRKVRENCESTRPEARSILVSDFHRVYFGKIVTAAEAGLVLAVGDVAPSVYAPKIDLFEFCGTALRRRSNVDPVRDGMKLLVGDFRMSTTDHLRTLTLGREFDGAKFRYLVVTDRPELARAIDTLARGGKAKVEFVILGIRENDVHGFLVGVEPIEAVPAEAGAAKSGDDSELAAYDSVEPMGSGTGNGPDPKSSGPPRRRIGELGSLALPEGRRPAGGSSGIRLNESFELKIGETLHLGSNGPAFQLLEVVDDGRCPPARTCDGTGQARVRVAIDTKTARRQELLFDFPSKSGAEKWAGVFRLRLIGLSPNASAGSAIDRKSYAAELVVDLGPIPKDDPKKKPALPRSLWDYYWDWGSWGDR